MNRLWNLNLNFLRPLSPHGFIMSDSCSDVHDLTGSESSTSLESLRSYNDPAEQAEQSFSFACGDARKRLIIQAYRNFHLQQGRTRRSVSGSSGRLLHDTTGLDFDAYRQRVEADLPQEVRGNIAFLLRLLDASWSVQLPQKMTSSLSGDWAGRTIRTRRQCFNGSSTSYTEPLPSWDIWTRRRGSLLMSLAGRQSTCCTSLPRSSLRAACLRSTGISYYNGLQKSGSKTVPGLGSGGLDRTTPIGKTGRKWSFKYGLCRTRRWRRRRDCSTDWRLNVPQWSFLWRKDERSPRS